MWKASAFPGKMDFLGSTRCFKILLSVKIPKEKLKVKRRKSGELRLEERSKGVEGKKTARSTVMDTGLCCNLSCVLWFSSALSLLCKNMSLFLKGTFGLFLNEK